MFVKQRENLPSHYWESLTAHDQMEFERLREYFHKNQKSANKDRRLVIFSKELLEILKFIEKSEYGREIRTILVGVCFAGQFIGVNTRQLKGFLGRCKSSINGSFQQLGYVAVKTKSKARSCILSILPSLEKDQNILRQWTVRCASDDSRFCFITTLKLSNLPVISREDLNDESKSSVRSTTGPTTTATVQWKEPVTVSNPSWFPGSQSYNAITDMYDHGFMDWDVYSHTDPTTTFLSYECGDIHNDGLENDTLWDAPKTFTRSHSSTW